MKTRMNVASEIVTRVRRSVAVLFFLVSFVHGIQLNPYAVFGQQGNIDPRVASQEAVKGKTDAVKGKTNESSVLIPIIPLSTLPVVFRLLTGGANGATAGIPCGCREAVTQLTLEYEGATAVPVTVFDSNKRELFTGTVDSGQQFSFTGYQNQKMRAVTLRVNDRFHTTIRTSCSQQVGPGLIRGDFVVISGKSSGEASLCPVQRSSRKTLKSTTIAHAGQE